MTVDNFEDDEVISNEIDTDSDRGSLLQVLELMKLMLKTEKMENEITHP